MDTRYTAVATVPQSAIKEITAGKLKGKFDINPQWRWEVMTETYGLCGEGWRFEVVDSHIQPVEATGESMLFVKVALFVKKDNVWSAPVYGYGGDFLIVKDKNGIHGNDEAYKMAVTDALGTAAKMIGVGADIYRGLQDTKVVAAAEREAKEKAFDPLVAYQTVIDMAKHNNITKQQIDDYIKATYKKEVKLLSRDELKAVYTWAGSYEVVNKGN